MAKEVLRLVLSASLLCVPALSSEPARAADDEGVDESHDDVKDTSQNVGESLGLREEVTGADGDSDSSDADGDEGTGIEGTTKKVADDLGVRDRVTHGSAYGPAGCGLGSLIFEPDSGFTQIFAATTNGTFGSQTFGITSGTSNCDDADAGQRSAKAFVETNRSALAKDIARGDGESISALSHLAGCENQHAVANALQQNFAIIFPSSSAADAEVSHAVVQLLQSKPELGCRSLG